MILMILKLGPNNKHQRDNSTDETRLPSHIVTTYSDGHRFVATDFTFTLTEREGSKGFDTRYRDENLLGQVAAFKMAGSNHLTHGDVLIFMNMNILTIIKKEKTETVVDYMKKDIKNWQIFMRTC